MNGAIRNNSTGRVLSFEQKGDFFYKRGNDKLDKNDLIEALCSYRRAMEQEPEDQYSRIAVAEVLSEMERYDDSNRVLLPLLSREDVEPEAIFGLGCNLAALNETDSAKKMLERYLQAEPEGEYIYDAYDLLDAIDDAEYRPGDFGELAPVLKEDMALDAAEEGRKALERENFPAAKEALERAIKLDPTLNYARNNLSLLHFCKKDYERALSEADTVLNADPNDTQALCNKAMVYCAMRDGANANAAADALCRTNTERADELCRISLVLMELGRFADAYKIAERLLKKTPYDEDALHRYAICAYELKRYDKAYNAYDKLCRIDPTDTIAKYYKKLCYNAQKGQLPRGNIRRFAANYQVPFDETVRRINRINELMKLSAAELHSQWQNSNELELLIRWGFTLPDIAIRRALLTAAAAFGDKRSEGLLRDFLLMREQDDELKRNAIAALAAMGAKQPYYLYIMGHLVESRAELRINAANAAYRNALTMCLANMYEHCSEREAKTAVSLWDRYVGAQERLPRISRAQEVALAAAIEYTARTECGGKPSRADICNAYGVSTLRLDNALKKLLPITAQEEK